MALRREKLWKHCPPSRGRKPTRSMCFTKRTFSDIRASPSVGRYLFGQSVGGSYSVPKSECCRLHNVCCAHRLYSICFHPMIARLCGGQSPSWSILYTNVRVEGFLSDDIR